MNFEAGWVSPKKQILHTVSLKEVLKGMILDQHLWKAREGEEGGGIGRKRKPNGSLWGLIKMGYLMLGERAEALIPSSDKLLETGYLMKEACASGRGNEGNESLASKG